MSGHPVINLLNYFIRRSTTFTQPLNKFQKLHAHRICDLRMRRARILFRRNNISQKNVYPLQKSADYFIFRRHENSNTIRWVNRLSWPE